MRASSSSASSCAGRIADGRDVAVTRQITPARDRRRRRDLAVLSTLRASYFRPVTAVHTVALLFAPTGSGDTLLTVAVLLTVLTPDVAFTTNCTVRALPFANAPFSEHTTAPAPPAAGAEQLTSLGVEMAARPFPYKLTPIVPTTLL